MTTTLSHFVQVRVEPHTWTVTISGGFSFIMSTRLFISWCLSQRLGSASPPVSYRRSSTESTIPSFLDSSRTRRMHSAKTLMGLRVPSFFSTQNIGWVGTSLRSFATNLIFIFYPPSGYCPRYRSRALRVLFKYSIYIIKSQFCAP